MFAPIKSYKTLGRYRQILLTVSRYGFGELLVKLKIRNVLGENAGPPGAEISRARRFRLLLEELGPTFIKFGQLLSTRSDLIPADMVEEMTNLQDRVTPLDWQHMEQRFDQVQLDITKEFEQFDQNPIASASLAQVYRAKLRGGQVVAVKVLRPQIKSIIEADLMILEQFAGLFAKHFEEARRWEPQGLIDEFRRSIKRELDLRHEGRNADIFRENFADDPTVYVPKIYWDLSSENILVMEFISGRKLSDFFNPEIDIQTRRAIAANGANAILKQVFVHAFQADPHPGNGFVLEDNVICFLDFGMFARLDKKSLSALAAGLSAVVKKDVDRLIKAYTSLGVITEDADIERLRPEFVDMMEQYASVPLKQISLAKILNQIVQIVRDHKLTMRSNLMMLIKALSTIESIGRRLDEDFNMIDHAGVFVHDFIAKEHAPGRFLTDAVTLGEDITELVKSAPAESMQILSKIRQGRLKLNFEHKGLEGPINELNRMTDKLILGLVTVGLLIASSLMAQIGKGPLFLGYPLVGILGFFAAALMVLWIVADIFRRK